MTFALFCSSKGIIPPKEWHHRPELCSNNGFTVALYLSSHGIIPPEEWNHSSTYIPN